MQTGKNCWYREYFAEDFVLKDDQNQSVFELHPKEKNYLNFKFYTSISMEEKLHLIAVV
ncbi:hypothetical protein N752_12965 [Desulforamulus aquiferis]|nr:hypothetical protein N752_12965 [Desulforamulus aquiferis]